jgi:hypothetical protein
MALLRKSRSILPFSDRDYSITHTFRLGLASDGWYLFTHDYSPIFSLNFMAPRYACYAMTSSMTTAAEYYCERINFASLELSIALRYAARQHAFSLSARVAFPWAPPFAKCASLASPHFVTIDTAWFMPLSPFHALYLFCPGISASEDADALICCY